MALELNGTTGVSLVQDGVVTSAKIADGAVAAADLASGAITSAALPAGSVLQVVEASVENSSSVTTNSTSYVDSGLLTLNITPKAAGSKIQVTFDGYIIHLHPANGNIGGSAKIYRNVAGGSFSAVTSGHNDGMYIRAAGNLAQNDWFDVKGHSRCIDSPTYTLGNQIQYKLYFRESDQNTASFHINHSGGLVEQGDAPTIIAVATEIAG